MRCFAASHTAFILSCFRHFAAALRYTCHCYADYSATGYLLATAANAFDIDAITIRDTRVDTPPCRLLRYAAMFSIAIAADCYAAQRCLP